MACALSFRYCIPAPAREYYSIGFFPIFLALGTYALLCHSHKQGYLKTTPAALFPFAVSLYLSSTFVIGSYAIIAPECIPFSNPFIYLAIFFASIPCFCFLQIILHCNILANTPLPAKLLSSFDDTSFSLLALHFFSAYPGYFSYDVNGQWLGEYWQIENGILSDHHSVLHTLFLGAALKIAPSINTAIAALSILQMLLCAFVSLRLFNVSHTWEPPNGSELALFAITASTLL